MKIMTIILLLLLNSIVYADTEAIKSIVTFDFDSASIRLDDEVRLKSIIKALNETRDSYLIQLIGYTDNVGPQGYNDKLAVQRARVVNEFLAKNGVDQKNIIYSGSGLCCYVANNGTDVGRQRNRRVEIIFRNTYMPMKTGPSAINRLVENLKTSGITSVEIYKQENQDQNSATTVIDELSSHGIEAEIHNVETHHGLDTLLIATPGTHHAAIKASDMHAGLQLDGSAHLEVFDEKINQFVIRIKQPRRAPARAYPETHQSLKLSKYETSLKGIRIDNKLLNK